MMEDFQVVVEEALEDKDYLSKKQKDAIAALVMDQAAKLASQAISDFCAYLDKLPAGQEGRVGVIHDDFARAHGARFTGIRRIRHNAFAPKEAVKAEHLPTKPDLPGSDLGDSRRQHVNL